MSSWVSIDKGPRTDFRSDRINATTGTKPFGKSKCHYTGGIYFDKIQNENSPLCGETKFDIIRKVSTNGEVAQLVEHHVRNVGVESSNLFFSTILSGS